MTRALHNSFFEERSQLLEELVYYTWNIVVLVVNDSHLRSTMLFLVVCSVLECKHRLVPNIINPFIICGLVLSPNTDVVDINRLFTLENYLLQMGTTQLNGGSVL